MSPTPLRSTFAHTDELKYRLRASEALLGVSHTTLRGYTDQSGIRVRRANEFNGKAIPTRVFEVDTIFSLAQWRRAQGYLKSPAPSGPVVIAVNVVKGGTGKTTTAVESAVHLQLMGLRTLCIDLDVQSNLTQSMGYESDLDAEEAENHGINHDALITATFADVVTPFVAAAHRGNSSRAPIEPIPDLIKKPFGEDGPHVICADTFLSDIEMPIANSKGARELVFRELFAEAARGKNPALDLSAYDVIVLDCPPNMSMTSTCAIAAADIVVAPVKMDAFARKGLVRLIGEIKSLKKTYPVVNPQLLILPTHYSPNITRISRMQAELGKYASMLSQQVISASEDFPKSLDHYLPLTLQRPTSKGASEYKLFAEILRGKIFEAAAARDHQV
ncbi:ParA family protein [Diaphorobacter sp. J5-51]|uniref:ParA family protein n=1 Tax=Diaphorobacter sp. J5-51 TaxID=680496 RepID=UPI000643C454|nr:ParA family protein [Diaphorobacter sp. J5-51]KLR59014.1 partitioning protein [Diaphorobacter sp. J5-51]